MLRSLTLRSAIFRNIEIPKWCSENNLKLSLKSVINNKIAVGIRRKAGRKEIDCSFPFHMYGENHRNNTTHKQLSSFTELEGIVESNVEHFGT